jgi:hypothetical protein
VIFPEQASFAGAVRGWQLLDLGEGISRDAVVFNRWGKGVLQDLSPIVGGLVAAKRPGGAHVPQPGGRHFRKPHIPAVFDQFVD